MNSEIKKPYTTPALIVYGDVEKITLGGSALNADVDGGPANTASCPANEPCVYS